MHPRIHPVLDGAMVSVQFGDAVALCARGQWSAICIFNCYLSLHAIDSDYQDRLELKSNNNRTLGFGVILSTNALLILTATTMMKIKLDLDVIQAFHAEWIMNPSIMWMRGCSLLAVLGRVAQTSSSLQ